MAKIPRHIPLRFCLTVLAGVIVFFVSFSRVFYSQELFFYDAHLQIRPQIPVRDDILIIEISDDTLKGLGRWPLPRDFHASLIDVLRSLGARQIIFDLLFTEPTEFDAVLAQAMHKAKNVYLPEAFYLDERPAAGPEPWRSPAVLSGISPALEQEIAGYGQINVLVDPDGKIRRVPLFVRYKDRRILSLGLQAACDLLGLDIKRVVFHPRTVVVDDKLVLPVSRGVFLANYPGRWRDTFRHISYLELLRSFKAYAEGGRHPLDLSTIRGKICFIGLTATGTSDFRANPIESVYPMVGLQASIYNSVLSGNFLKVVEPWVNGALALAVFALVLAIGLGLAPRYAFFLNVLLAVFYFFLTHLLFVKLGVWVDFFWPLIVVAGTYGGCLFFRFLREAEQRKLLEKELDIARTIQENFLPRDISPLGGVFVSAFMQPAKFVAGDLYDVITLDDGRLGVLIGDVAGKGVPAALIMAQTVSFFRIFARAYATPADVFRAMNKELTPFLKGRFVTGIYIVIDTSARTLEVVCAGHSPLLSYKADLGSLTEFAAESGPPLGIVGDYVYKNTACAAESGDKIFLYTDGITEARRGREEFGLDRLTRFLKENIGLTGRELLDALTRSVVKFQGTLPQHDDFTSVLIEFK